MKNTVDEFGREIKYCKHCKAHAPHVRGRCLGCVSTTEETTVYSQVWRCKLCKASGAVIYTEKDRAESVIGKIIEQHRGRTVLCPAGLKDLWVYGPMDKIN